jgi:hypothetical protein
VRALATTGKVIWLFGGGVPSAAYWSRPVDQVQVAIVPVLLGDGLPLVAHPAKLAKLKLQKQRVYQNTGTVLLDYAVVTRQRHDRERPIDTAVVGASPAEEGSPWASRRCPAVPSSASRKRSPRRWG